MIHIVSKKYLYCAPFFKLHDFKRALKLKSLLADLSSLTLENYTRETTIGN